MPYEFNKPPERRGNPDCDTCYGLGWTLDKATVTKCEPCNAYRNDTGAARAAARTLSRMYVKLGPGEQLASGYGYEPFVLHPLRELTDKCTDCGGELMAVDAGYEWYGTVSLEEEVLLIENVDLSEAGSGPHYLSCTECQRAYLLPDEVEFE